MITLCGLMSRWTMVLVLVLLPSMAMAQELPEVPEVELPVSGEIVALERGDRAPSAGMLILDADLVAWRHRIERLTFELHAERVTAAAICESRIEQERLRLAAAEDRLELRERLWGDEASRLAAELVTAREEANAGPDFLEHPLLWFGTGFVVAALGGVAIAAALR